jgi:hypothetical protein
MLLSEIVKVMSENVCQVMYISNIFYKITKRIEIAGLVLYSVKEKYSLVTASSCYTYFYKSDNIYLMTERYVSHWVQYNRYEIWKLDLLQHLYIMYLHVDK